LISELEKEKKDLASLKSQTNLFVFDSKKRISESTEETKKFVDENINLFGEILYLKKKLESSK